MNKSRSIEPISALAILVVGVAALLVHHAYFFYGYFGYDDMHYAKLSHRLLDGVIDFGDHYSYRWPILLATSVSYLLFGVSDLSTALPALMVSSGMLWVMYLIFRDHPFSLFCAVMLFFSIKWNVFYTDKLMPDIYVSFFLLLAWSLYLSFEHCTHIWLRSVAFVSSLLLAFMSKGTAVLILPLLAYYFVYDWRKGRLHRWRATLPMGLLGLFLYLGLLFLLTGDPLARFRAIESNSYFNECSYSEMPIALTWDRLTVDFMRFITDQHLVLFLIGAAILKVYSFFGAHGQKTKSKINFYLSTIVVLFLSINFMSFSFTSYNPGCLDIRHYIFSVPIMAVCLGKVLGLLHLPKWFRAIIVVFLVIAILPTVQHMRYATTLKYGAQREAIQQLVQYEVSSDRVFVSNQVLVNLINYYSSFQLGDRLIAIEDWQRDACGTQCYLLSSWYSEFHAGTSMEQMKEQLGGEGLKPANDLHYLGADSPLSAFQVVDK